MGMKAEMKKHLARVTTARDRVYDVLVTTHKAAYRASAEAYEAVFVARDDAQEMHRIAASAIAEHGRALTAFAELDKQYTRAVAQVKKA